MKRLITIVLMGLSLAACSNCNIYSDNDGNQERCWIYQLGL